jgi:para-aminobenzoate synthetase/4-amino-4-deoxychorismate lyase
MLDAQTGTAEYGVGGGITWDSRAASEFDEAVAKAKVLTERRPRFDLYETMRHDPEGGLLNLERHLARLRGSAGYFGFRVDEARIATALEAELAPWHDRAARVRVTLDRRGAVTVKATALPPSPQPVRLALDSAEPVDPSDPMLFHKTSRRRRYEEAAARHPDADDVVLTNTRGEITESTIANIAVQLDGRWVTPALDCGLLPGVGREVALEDGWLAEGVVTVEDLRRVEGLALVSDVRGRRDAVLVDG